MRVIEPSVPTKGDACHRYRTIRRCGASPSSSWTPVNARQRVRSIDGNEEVHLDTYGAFTADDLLGEVVMARMLAGLATRRHRAANEPVGAAVEAEATSTSRSAVSRRFIAGTTRALEELMSRDLAELDVVVLMVDGVTFAEACCVVALAITADGTKVPVGLWLGDTENKTIVTALLADLVARGLDASSGLLVVIDGAKALAAGVRKVFGDQALVQRCVVHYAERRIMWMSDSDALSRVGFGSRRSA